MTGGYLYIPLICCGQTMNDILVDRKRVAATCSVCGRIWKPENKVNNGAIHFTRVFIKNEDTDATLDEVLRQGEDLVDRIRTSIQISIDSILMSDVMDSDKKSTSLVPIWKDEDEKKNGPKQ
jgi:hypothetical protein